MPEINVTNGHTESGSNQNAIVAPSKFLELPPSLLTVADEAFQRKSSRKLGSFKRKKCIMKEIYMVQILTIKCSSPVNMD